MFSRLASDFADDSKPNPCPRSRLRSAREVAPAPMGLSVEFPRPESHPMDASTAACGQLARPQTAVVRDSRGVDAPPCPATTSDAQPAKSTTSRTPRLRLVAAGEDDVFAERMEGRSIRTRSEL